MTLNEATQRLLAAGVPDARYDARELFYHALGLTRGAYIDPEKDYGCEKLDGYIERRCAREPLQYIIGKVGFFREEYKVTPDVLIPRSDTECLVEYAVKNLPRGARFLDICCGSGCIAISTLNNTKDTTATAVDISEGALAVARENAEKIGVESRLSLLSSDALKSLPEGRFYAALSNPPYVSESAYRELLPEIYKEPRIAFLGGADGGDFYRSLTPRLKEIIEPEGFIAYEIGYDQVPLMESLAEEYSLSLSVMRDLGGNPRVAVFKKSTI